jgi:Arc/MetJ family transcription regulator
MTRTNVEVDDRLIGRVMRRYRLPSKRAAIDFALHRVDIEPLTREEALAMRGTGWDGDLDRLRSGYLSQARSQS